MVWQLKFDGFGQPDTGSVPADNPAAFPMPERNVTFSGPSNPEPGHKRMRREKAREKAEKLSGQYYTPMDLARYLADWVWTKGVPQRILEPSAGDGNFVLACLEQALQRNGPDETVDIVAVEMDREAVERGRNRVQAWLTQPTAGTVRGRISWVEGDFFHRYGALREQGPYDAMVGNPPFIRSRHVAVESRRLALMHLRAAGVRLSGLSNIWAAFVHLGIELLKPGGRLAMVVPSDILQVGYAAQLRWRLSRQFERITLIGFRKLVFSGVQQGVLLLLADGRRATLGESCAIHTFEVDDGADLIRQTDMRGAVRHSPDRYSSSGTKWTALFLSDQSFSVLDEAGRMPELVPLGRLARVDVGIVTGQNRFFVLDQKSRDAFGLAEYTCPVIGRTAALRSVLFRDMDYMQYMKAFPAWLLALSGVDERSFPPGLRDYLAHGVQSGIPDGFKCRVRRRWFDVPSVNVSPGLISSLIYRFPLLVLNQAGVLCTDTLFRVYFRPGVVPELLVAAFFNSLTLAWTEMTGRSYGGGILELTPGEAESLRLPYSAGLESDLDVEKVDGLLRRERTYEALDYVDEVVLRAYLGFDRQMIRRIRSAWEELRQRRLKRHRPVPPEMADSA